jgi:flavin-dependent dehydrogenase
MPSESIADYDVVVVGAGTAGAATAYQCARRGMSVLCVERRSLDQAGARWVNGVHASAFDMAEIPRPRAPEKLAQGVDFHLVAGHGPEKVVIRDHELMEVDMRELVARLQTMAAEAGAVFWDKTTVHDFDGATLETSNEAVTATYYVDASGLNGVDMLDSPPVAPEDICVAAQQVHDVTDATAAERYCERYGARPGETICLTGIAGGYSILNVRVDHDHVSILTGSIPASGHPSGRTILGGFVDTHDWIGERQFGGSRAIPLGRPRQRLGRGNTALVGDAANQVFAAHGSGIGAGMVAGRYLADALADGRGTEGYSEAWHRDFGGLFRAYDTFRRFSETLTQQKLAALMQSGLMDAEMTRAGLEQRMPALTFNKLLQKAIGAIRAPELALEMAPIVIEMLADVYFSQLARAGSA